MTARPCAALTRQVAKRARPGSMPSRRKPSVATTRTIMVMELTFF
ncbi:hypothetical protein [Streptosporangium sp. NPDC049644]